MGAHTAPGHHPGSTVAAAGVAAAVVTTSGILGAGTALASDGHGHGYGEPGHDHVSRSHERHDTDVTTTADGEGADPGSEAALCGVLGGFDLGGSCTPGDAGQATSTQPAATSSLSDAHETGPTRAPSPPPPPPPAPAPHPTSSVPDHPTIQPIVA